MRKVCKLYIILFSLPVLFNCTNTAPRIQFMSFGQTSNSHISVQEVTYYEDYLSIGSEFVEIGVVVINKYLEPAVSVIEIKEIAATRGANGIILEGKNYVLLHIPNKTVYPKDSNNETQI